MRRKDKYGDCLPAGKAGEMGTPYPASRIPKQYGFTLIELLIVIVIISIIASAIYATLSNGIRIWQRINQKTSGEDLAFFLDRFASDIRNCRKFTGINLTGELQEVAFASLVNSSRLGFRSIGEIRYVYNSEEGQLNRQALDFSHIANSQEGVHSCVLKNIRAFSFKYYLYDDKEKNYFWAEDFNQEGVPLALQLELEFTDDAKKIIRTYDLPIAQRF